MNHRRCYRNNNFLPRLRLFENIPRFPNRFKRSNFKKTLKPFRADTATTWCRKNKIERRIN